MQQESQNLIFGFALSYCLQTLPYKDKSNPKAIRGCYAKHFPLAARQCPAELDDMASVCGLDNKVHRECQRTWKTVQRCMHYQGFWEDSNPLTKMEYMNANVPKATSEDPNKK